LNSALESWSVATAGFSRRFGAETSRRPQEHCAEFAETCSKLLWSIKLRFKKLLAVALLTSSSAIVGCSRSADAPAAANLSQLPYLGEKRPQLENRLANYKIDYNPDGTNPLTFYRFKIDGDLIRLSFIYALRRDGTDVLSGIDIMPDNIEGGHADLSDEATTLSDESRMAVVNAMLPSRTSVPIASLSSAVQQDASPAGGNEDSAFFRSGAATKRVLQQPYWDIPKQSWISAAQCPASSPSIVQVYSSTTDGHADGAGIYSEWLYECMKKEMFK
jgi:hypothetical protein